MKTPMQELLERVKEYRDSETDVMVISRLNSVCVDIVGMLEKEEEMIKKAWWAGCDEGASDHKIYPSENCNGYYNETFDIKERST